MLPTNDRMVASSGTKEENRALHLVQKEKGYEKRSVTDRFLI
jgi:hypothetical protein